MYILCVYIFIYIYIHTYIYIHVYKYMNFFFTHAFALSGLLFFCKNLHTYIYQIENMYTLLFLSRASFRDVLYSCIFKMGILTYIHNTYIHKYIYTHAYVFLFEYTKTSCINTHTYTYKNCVLPMCVYEKDLRSKT